ncbi:MAG: UvrD-helicase domain-containing protein [Chloroflexi bacterium]|nr:UvrD-helicase domain-containing protein [Chloroflexota bacterium]
MDTILSGLNPRQREAVEAVAGPLLILAGPGSGKTRVITHRIAYLIKVVGVKPHNIIAVTFTNKAAREMRARLEKLVPTSVEHLTLGTFHAICARLLRREGQAIGLDSHYVIYDEDDQVSAVRRVLKELELDEKANPPRAIIHTISAAKSELRTPVLYAEYATSYHEEVILRVYRRYQEVLAEHKALDFDDLLMTTDRLFRERPDVLEKYQDRYVHVMVDEFQDTNIAQYVISKKLAGKHRNVCVVGDEDQSIYSWRQADIRNILNFEYDFPDARVVCLDQNYRSTKTILNAARQVISANSMRKDKQLWTSNQDGVPITIFEAYNEEEEATYVVSEIERLVSRGLHEPRDFAVMYRANAQSRVLERAFYRRQMPHRLVGMRFYERKEIKDVLAYLRVIQNPYDGVSLDRIINVPNRGLGAKTLAELGRWAHQLGVPVWDALRVLAGDEPAAEAAAAGVITKSPFSTRAEQLLLKAFGLFEDLRHASSTLNVADLIRHVLDASGYQEMVRDGTEEGNDRWENILELIAVASEYAGLEPKVSLTAFLEEAALATDVDDYNESDNAVTLITLHTAKGLEFPVVFIVGMEDGICPHIRSFDDAGRMEEERRLCYVGMTRAKERLFLVYAFRRTLYGNSTVNTPSRFLADIPPNLVSGWRDKTTSTAKAPLGRSTPEIEQKAVPKVPVEPVYRPGDRVRHAKFGEGIVISTVVLADDQEVSVAFPEIGVKKLSLKFAPLEKV